MHATHGVSDPIAYGISATRNARTHTHTHSLWSQTSRFPHVRGNRLCYGHRKAPLRCNGYVLTWGRHWAGPCWNALTPAPRHAAPSDLSFKLHKNQLVFILMQFLHKTTSEYNHVKWHAKSRLRFLTQYWKQFNRRCKEMELNTNSWPYSCNYRVIILTETIDCHFLSAPFITANIGPCPLHSCEVNQK